MLWPSGLHLQLVGLLGEMEMRDVSYMFHNRVRWLALREGDNAGPLPYRERRSMSMWGH